MRALQTVDLLSIRVRVNMKAVISFYTYMYVYVYIYIYIYFFAELREVMPRRFFKKSGACRA